MEDPGPSSSTEKKPSGTASQQEDATTSTASAANTPSRLEQLRARQKKMLSNSQQKIAETRKSLVTAGLFTNLFPDDDAPETNKPDGENVIGSSSDPPEKPSLPQHHYLQENDSLKQQVAEFKADRERLQKELKETRDELETVRSNEKFENEVLTNRIQELESVNKILREEVEQARGDLLQSSLAFKFQDLEAVNETLLNQTEKLEEQLKSAPLEEIPPASSPPAPPPIDLSSADQSSQEVGTAEQHGQQTTPEQSGSTDLQLELENSRRLNKRLSEMVEELNSKINDLHSQVNESNHKDELPSSDTKQLQELISRDSSLQMELEQCKDRLEKVTLEAARAEEDTRKRYEALAAAAAQGADVEQHAYAFLMEQLQDDVMHLDAQNQDVVQQAHQFKEKAAPTIPSSAGDRGDTQEGFPVVSTIQGDPSSGQLQEDGENKADSFETVSAKLTESCGRCSALENELEQVKDSKERELAIVTKQKSLLTQVVNRLKEKVETLRDESTTSDVEDRLHSMESQDLDVGAEKQLKLQKQRQSTGIVMTQLANSSARNLALTEEVEEYRQMYENATFEANEQQEALDLMESKSNEIANLKSKLIEENEELQKKVHFLENTTYTAKDRLHSMESQDLDVGAEKQLKLHKQRKSTGIVMTQLAESSARILALEQELNEYRQMYENATFEADMRQESLDLIESELNDRSDFNSKLLEQSEELNKKIVSLEKDKDELADRLDSVWGGEQHSNPVQIQKRQLPGDSTALVMNQVAESSARILALEQELHEYRQMYENSTFEADLRQESLDLIESELNDKSNLNSKLIEEIEALNKKILSSEKAKDELANRLDSVWDEAQHENIVEMKQPQLPRSSTALVMNQMAESSAQVLALEKYETATFEADERQEALDLMEIESNEIAELNSKLIEQNEELQKKVHFLESTTSDVEDRLHSMESQDLDVGAEKQLKLQKQRQSTGIVMTQLANSSARNLALTEEVEEYRQMYENATFEANEQQEALDLMESKSNEIANLKSKLIEENEELQKKVHFLENTTYTAKDRLHSMESQDLDVGAEKQLKLHKQRKSTGIVMTQLAESSARILALEQELNEYRQMYENATFEADMRQESLDLIESELNDRSDFNSKLLEQSEELNKKIVSLEKDKDELADRLDSVWGGEQHSNPVQIQKRQLPGDSTALVMNQVAESSARILALEQELHEYRQMYENSTFEADLRQESLDLIESELNDKSNLNSKLIEEIEALNKKILSSEKAKDELANRLDSVWDEAQHENIVEMKQPQLPRSSTALVMNQMAESSAQVLALEQELEEVRGLYENATFEADERQESLDWIESELNDKSNLNSKLIEQIEELNKKIISLENDIISLENDNDELTNRLDYSIDSKEPQISRNARILALEQELEEVRELYENATFEAEGESSEKAAFDTKLIAQNEELQEKVHSLEKTKEDLLDRLGSIYSLVGKEKEDELKSAMQSSPMDDISAELAGSSARSSVLERELESTSRAVPYELESTDDNGQVIASLQPQTVALDHADALQRELTELKEEYSRLAFEKARSLEQEHEGSLVLESVVSDYKKECARLTFEFGEANDSMEKMQQELDGSLRDCKKLTEQVEELQAKLASEKQTKEGFIEQMQQRSLAMVSTHSSLEKELEETRAKFDSAVSETRDCKERLDKQRYELEETQARNEAFADKVEELKSNILSLESTNQDLAEDLQRIKTEQENEARLSKEQSTEQIQRASTQEEEFRGMDSTLLMELEQTKDKLAATESGAESREEAMDKYEHELEESRRSNEELREELSELREECSSLRAEKERSLEKEQIARLTFDYGETKDQLESAQRELDDSRDLSKVLKEQVDELQAMIGTLEASNKSIMENNDGSSKADIQSELLDFRFRNTDLSSNVDVLDERVKDLEDVNHRLIEQLRLFEGDQSEDVVPRLRAELFNAASRESYLNKELTETKSRLQQDRHLLSCISTELYDSTFRESQLQDELATCYKRLEFIANQVVIVQEEMQKDTEQTFDNIIALLDGNEWVEERHDVEDHYMTEPQMDSERRLVPMEPTQLVERGSNNIQKLLTASQRELQNVRRQNKHLSNQVESLQAKVKDLESAPRRDAEPDGYDAVERCNEMKKSLESLTSVLEEMNESNRRLTSRIVELEAQLQADEEEKETQNATIDENTLDDALRLNEELIAKVEELIQKQEAMQKDMEESRDDVSQYRKELEDERFCNGVLKDVIGKLNTMNDDLEGKYRKAVENLQTISEERDNADVSKENMALLEECKFLRSQKREYSKAIANLENQLAKVVSERKVDVAEDTELLAKIDALSTANEQLQRDLETIESQNSKKLDAAMNRNKWLDGQLVKAQEAIMDLASKAKSLRQAHSEDLDEANEREVRLTKEVMTQRAQMQTVEAKLAQKDKEFEELEEDLEAIRQEAQSMIENLRSQVESLKSRNDELSRELESLRAH